MTDSEWDRVVELLVTNWPNREIPRVSLGKWHFDLEDLPGDQVLVAVEALYRDGREWCPNGAQIRAKVIDLTFDLPEWPQVLRALGRIADKGTVACVVGGELQRIDERAEALAEQPPALRAFVARLGWGQVSDGVFGDGSDEARLREKWTAFTRSARHDLAYRGLASAGLARIERANGPRPLGKALAELVSES